jgi:hypothetical protein
VGFNAPDGLYRPLAERPNKMDNETLEIGIFLKSLSAEEVDECESYENELTAIRNEGLSEANAVCFVRTMLVVKRLMPDATVEGLSELAFKLGLAAVLAQLASPDVAKPTRKKKLQRGVRVIGAPGSGRGRGGVSIREA